MKSLLYSGEIFHHRLQPVRHRFRYPLFFCGVDLERLEQKTGGSWLFGYNRPALLSLYDSDYFDLGEGSIRAKVERFLRSHGQAAPCHSIFLVTCARFLGYVFNPVSFYFCYNSPQNLRCVVAEVNNTFGERHAYLLDEPLEPSSKDRRFLSHYRVPKAFYVSPFNGVEGEYDFRLADPQRELDIRLKVFKDSRPIFNSWMRGQAQPLTTHAIMRTVSRYPLTTWKTVARIHKEAALLYFRKHLPIVYKPRPQDPLRAVPSGLQKLCMELVRGFLEGFRSGGLVIDFPNGEEWKFGGAKAGARLSVLNYDFFLRLVRDGDIALGDGYVEGQFDSPDLTALVRFFIENRDSLNDKQLAPTRWLGRLWHRLRHRLRRNTLWGSRRNIKAHYDLGNDLYSRFLDKSMSYSCAIYAEGDDLEQAQRNKIKRVLEKARLEPGMRVLEIGCGWGSLAIEAARTYGCVVTGLTLSDEQLSWGRQRVQEEGLQSQVRLETLDYRQAQGSYDRIISIEMLEAVGHENFGSYFQALERLLAEDGLAVLQAITVPDHEYEEYRRGCDWIQKEIFPGALVPSLSALTEAMRKNSRLQLEELENIGPHYARTLRDWRQRFNANWPEIEKAGYSSKFRRTWDYYLSYCEAAFATRNLGDLQLVLTRPKNRALLSRDPEWL